MESKPPLSARRTAAELTAWRLAQNGQLLYNVMRREYEYQQRRWRPPWDSLPEATKQLWIDIARKFLARAITPTAKTQIPPCHGSEESLS